MDTDKYDLNNRTKKTNGNKASKSVDLKRRSIQASQSNLKKATNVDKPHQNQKKFSCLFKIAPIIASIGFPAYVYALHMFCNEFQCSFKTPVNFSTYQKLSTYFDTQSSLVFTAYVGLLVILSLIPIGGEKVSELSDQHEKFNYNINGVFSLVIATLTIAALEVCGIPAFDYIDKHIVHFIFPAIIFSFLLALFSYIRSFSVPLSKLSSETTSNGALLSFIIGREINPRFFGIWDVKVFTIRWCLISAILLPTVYFYKSLTFPEANAEATVFLTLPRFNPTITIIYTFVFIYLLDGLICEGTYLSSFEIQYRSFGFLNAVGYILYPFMAVMFTKYPYEHGLNAPMWQLAVGIMMFSTGYWLFRASNSQKDAFRRNPNAPSLSHLKTIPTPQGKKLIVSSYWGFVRHPNYLGDLLLSSGILLFFYDVPVSTVILFSVVFLFVRSVIDGYSCKQKYGPAWDRYCQKVKYVLIPMIY